MQPAVMSAMVGAAEASAWEYEASPKSLLTIAMSSRPSVASVRASSVLLPLPKNPVSTVTGMRVMGRIPASQIVDLGPVAGLAIDHVEALAAAPVGHHLAVAHHELD